MKHGRACRTACTADVGITSDMGDVTGRHAIAAPLDLADHTRSACMAVHESGATITTRVLACPSDCSCTASLAMSGASFRGLD